MTRRMWIRVIPAGLTGMRHVGAQGQSSAAAGEKREVGIIVLDVTAHGIFPPVTTVPEGWYLISVRNGVSIGPVNVRLDNENEPNVMKESVGNGKSGVQKLTQLKAGTHTLTVGTRKGWSAKLVVTKNGEK